MNETTGSNKEFNQWADKLSHMSDREASREIYNRIMSHSDINKDALDVFSDAYEYCIKLIDQGKPLETNLLKIYLEEVKGRDINKINVVNLFTLLGICGINFNKQ